MYLVSGGNSAELTFGFGEERVGLSEGIGLVVGTWIMGVLNCVPDITRFARTPLQGGLVASIGVFLANGFTLLLGALGAAYTGEADPALILFTAGFLPLAVVLSLANIWTTNDSNMYSATLNLARMLSIKRRTAVVVGTALAAMFAAFDPTSIVFLFSFLGFMGATAPALGGVVLGAYLVSGPSSARPLAWHAWLGWGVGSALSVMVGGAWSAPVGFFVGFGVWVSLRQWLGSNTRVSPVA